MYVGIGTVMNSEQGFHSIIQINIQYSRALNSNDRKKNVEINCHVIKIPHFPSHKYYDFFSYIDIFIFIIKIVLSVT